MVTSHLVTIEQLETEMDQILTHLNPRQKGGISSDTIANPKADTTQCMNITTHSSKVIFDETPKGNVAKSRKGKTIIFQSDELVKVLNNYDEPQPNVNVDNKKGKEKVIPPSAP